ncbi:hypothetical protein, partial [Streptomyces alfalfae]
MSIDSPNEPQRQQLNDLLAARPAPRDGAQSSVHRSVAEVYRAQASTPAARKAAVTPSTRRARSEAGPASSRQGEGQRASALRAAAQSSGSAATASSAEAQRPGGAAPDGSEEPGCDEVGELATVQAQV